jgi:hypothetical protein
LLTRSPFTALLRLPLQESPEELYFNTYRVTDDDELKEFANGVRVWRLKGNAVNMYKRPFEREPEFNLSLAPGLYVFNVGAEWKDKGSVIYGFLVQVNEREAKITNNVSQAFSSTASYSTYAPGDLILSHEDRLYLLEKDVAMVSRECGENMTLLKEGYLFLFDNVTDNYKELKRYADFSLYKNGEIVTKLNVKQGDFFYYNKTIDGNEYTIIKFKLVNIFSSDGLCSGSLAQIQPFFQYSDGTGGQEIQIGNSGFSPLEEWNRTFGGLDENTMKPVKDTIDDYLNQLFFRSTFIEMSVQETKDGGFIMARSYIPASSNKWSGTPFFLNRIDAEDNELWNKTISEPKTRIYSIEETEDNGFVAAGDILPTMQNNLNAWFVKIDSNGSEEWNRTFGDKYEYTPNFVYKTKNSSTASFVSKTKDGGYFLLVVTMEPEGGHFGLIRTDPEGNELWNRTLGLKEYIDRISSLAQTDDGGCIITSVTREEFGNYYDSKLIKLDSNGSEQWNRSFGGEYDDILSSVRQIGDGGYIIAGMTESYGGHDAWLIKTYPNGDEQWNRTFYAGGGSEALDVRQTRDGFILAGRRISYEGNDALLIKTDQDGNEQWMKTFGGKYDDEALFVNQTTDGAFILAGTTESYGSGNKDGWLIKVSGKPGGTGNIPAASQTGTGNTKRNITGISNKTETLAASPTRTVTSVPTETSTIIPPENTAGFEGFLATMALLFAITVRRNRGKS